MSLRFDRCRLRAGHAGNLEAWACRRRSRVGDLDLDLLVVELAVAQLA
jgi:hypothetical protein